MKCRDEMSSTVRKRRLSHMGRFTRVTEIESNLSIVSGLMILDRRSSSSTTTTSFTSSSSSSSSSSPLNGHVDDSGDDDEDDLSWVTTLFEHRVVNKHDRFRCLVSHDGKYFIPDEDFCMDRHVHYHWLDKKDDNEIDRSDCDQVSGSAVHHVKNELDKCNNEPGQDTIGAVKSKSSNDDHDDAALRRLISSLQNLRFDPQRPLWALHIIRGYSRGLVVFWRAHHCMGDGRSIGQVIVRGLCDDPQEDMNASSNSNEGDARDEGPVRKRHVIVRPMRTESEHCTAVTNRGDTVEIDSAKRDYVSKWVQWWLSIVALASFLWAVLVLLWQRTVEICRGREPDTVFKSRQLGTRKAVAWSRRLTLSESKEIGRHTNGATVNDIVLSCIAAAMQRYREVAASNAQNDKTEKKDLAQPVSVRISLPVDIRNGGTVTELGNVFGMLVSRLPLSSELDCMERLAQVKSRMDWAKSLPEPRVAFVITALLDMLLPARLVQLIFTTLTQYLTLVCSNTRAPSRQMRFRGRQILDFMGFVPPPPGVAIGCLVMSYQDSITFTISTDHSVVPDPEALVKFFDDEFEQLLSRVRSMSMNNYNNNNNPM